jgi:hypothetical protein
MNSENIKAGRLVKATGNWIHGVNSVRSPWSLPEDQAKFAVNVNLRGGIAQTRNGFKMQLSLPKGNFQGGIIFNANKQARAASTSTNLSGNTISQKQTIYTPEGTEFAAYELPYAVFVVDGKAYYSPFPLTQPKTWSDYQLSGIDLDPNIAEVSIVIATQSAAVNTSGGSTVTPSHRMVIFQDSINTPCYWDGSDKTGNIIADMPIGYWMAFSGNRLWVANGNIISASDLANPLGWTERTTGAGRGDFSVPRPVTAMHDHIGQNNDSRLYVFTDQATYSLASGILDRDQWSTTANFQQTLFPNIGCIAGKSIAFQNGLMWWYSQGGLVSVDVAASSYLSSQVLYKDVEMAKAKRLMAPDYTGICATSYENYLLYSIPYLEPLNSATMVLDYASASEWNQARNPAWAGVWTGIRPINWSTNLINGTPRCFAFSVDYTSTSDGSFNHIWEAFVPERYDTYLEINQDGTTTERINRIYCQFETGLLGDEMGLKQLVYGELDCTQIAGTVDVKVSYRGSKGVYLPILNSRILAVTDPYQYETSKEADRINNLGILQTQYRRLITENVQRTTKSESCESKYTLDVDKAFSFLVEWCGAMGVDAIRMYQDPWIEKSVGRTNSNENVYCVVGEDGSSISVDLSPAPQEQASNGVNSWSSSQTRTVTLRCTSPQTGAAVSATATASFTSYVSLDDANTQAAALATQQATNAANQYRIAHPCT